MDHAQVMMIYTVGALTIPLFNMIVWSVIFFNRKFNKLIRSYLLWSFLISAWSIGYAVTLSGMFDKDMTLLWNRICHGFASLIPAAFLTFIYEVTGEPSKKNRAVCVTAWMCSGSLILLGFTPYFVKDLWTMGPFRYQPLGGPFYAYFTGVFFTFTIYAFYVLIRRANVSTGSLKQQLQIFIIGSLIAYSGGFTLFFQGFRISVHPIGVFFVSSYALFTGYAIYKHQFLDLKLAIKRSIFYSGFAFCISLLYVVLVSLSQKIFYSNQIPPENILGNIVIVLILAILFRPVEVFLRKMLDHLFFKGTISEISEQKEKLEYQLERQQRLKSVGILAAGMAHEIKNPITSLQTFIEYLPQKKEDPEYIERFQRIAGQEISRIKNIVSDLLAFSKPHEPKRQDTDIRKILLSILDLLSGEFIKYKIKTIHNFQEESPDVFVDPEQIKQAFLNIILNAIDAMKEKGGELSVMVSQEKDKILVSIQDAGCGIDPDKLPHIFDPFYTNKDGGTGLGLAITHSIIEKNKGQIIVKNQLRQGAEFRISLPKSLGRLNITL